MDKEKEEFIRTIFSDAGITESLACPIAFELSETHGIDKLDFARYCNKNGIKIRKCQLGCFK